MMVSPPEFAKKISNTLQSRPSDNTSLSVLWQVAQLGGVPPMFQYQRGENKLATKKGGFANCRLHIAPWFCNRTTASSGDEN